jgi:hypothetical protein
VQTTQLRHPTTSQHIIIDHATPRGLAPLPTTMSGSRNVRFEEGSSSSRHRSDSGIGSTSSQEANTGRRPDRRFTEQDREHQRGSVHALQEALETTTQQCDKYKKKCLDYEDRLSKANKTNKETEAQWRAGYDRNETLQEEKKMLAQQLQELRLSYNAVRDECNEWKQKYLDVTEPINEPVMRGGGGSGGSGDSSDGMKRTKSKRDGGQADRLKERMNRPTREAETSSRGSQGHRPPVTSKPTHHARRASISAMPTSRKPYIEEPADDGVSRPPVTNYRYDSYANTGTGSVRSPAYSGMDPFAATSSIPRNVHPTVGVSTYVTPGHHTEVVPGDYVPLPLPKKHRHHESAH